MELVDLIAHRPQHDIRQVRIKELDEALPNTDWYYLARNISKEEARYHLAHTYANKTQQKC